jgi:hypothetical protein
MTVRCQKGSSEFGGWRTRSQKLFGRRLEVHITPPRRIRLFRAPFEANGLPVCNGNSPLHIPGLILHLCIYARDRLGCKFALFIVLLARHGGLRTIGRFEPRFKLRSIGKLFNTNCKHPARLRKLFVFPLTMLITTASPVVRSWGMRSLEKESHPTTSPHLTLAHQLQTFQACSS